MAVDEIAEAFSAYHEALLRELRGVRWLREATDALRQALEAGGAEGELPAEVLERHAAVLSKAQELGAARQRAAERLEALLQRSDGAGRHAANWSEWAGKVRGSEKALSDTLEELRSLSREVESLLAEGKERVGSEVRALSRRRHVAQAYDRSPGLGMARFIDKRE